MRLAVGGHVCVVRRWCAYIGTPAYFDHEFPVSFLLPPLRVRCLRTPGHLLLLCHTRWPLFTFLLLYDDSITLFTMGFINFPYVLHCTMRWGLGGPHACTGVRTSLLPCAVKRLYLFSRSSLIMYSPRALKRVIRQYRPLFTHTGLIFWPSCPPCVRILHTMSLYGWPWWPLASTNQRASSSH
jgi:hypothetical protein